jgi:UTP:GlnB (protein PII) uridylyltransferase
VQVPALRTKASHRVAEVRSYLDLHRTELLAMLGTEGSAGVALAARHSKIMDGLLSALYPAAFATLHQQHRWVPVLLGAVGGYGRELLGWKSDLDVRLLTTETPELIQPVAEAILYPLWDAGVSIGHQVMTITDAVEAARNDLPTATALLDFRPIAGDESAAQMLEARIFEGIFSEGELPNFIGRLENEVTHRHRRFGDSLYLLEPDVRNGAGGLRDLDIALWAARARVRTRGVEYSLRAKPTSSKVPSTSCGPSATTYTGPRGEGAIASRSRSKRGSRSPWGTGST